MSRTRMQPCVRCDKPWSSHVDPDSEIECWNYLSPDHEADNPHGVWCCQEHRDEFYEEAHRRLARLWPGTHNDGGDHA